LEVELKSKFDHVKIDLISSGGGVFEVRLDNKLIFSKKALERFPEEGEVEKLILGNLN
jgi:selenoprotein W-related protein